MKFEFFSSAKERVQSSIDSIAGTGSVARCSYPSSLATNPAHTNYLVFHIVEAISDGNLTSRSLQTRRSNFLKNPAAMKTIGMIQMYMPAMMENFDHDYASSQTSMLGAFADSLVRQTGGDIGLNEKTAQALPDAAAAGANVWIQDNLSKVKTITQQTGKVHGQRQGLLYGSTQLRSQTFTFQLRARNLPELKEIGDIIHMFRKFSSGTSTTADVSVGFEENEDFGAVLVPPVWFVEERTKNTLRPRMIDKFMMGPATVTSVKVNKTPDQLYQTIAGTSGDPVSVELEITLKEMVPCYSDYWDQLRSVSLSNGAQDSIGDAVTNVYRKATNFLGFGDE